MLKFLYDEKKQQNFLKFWHLKKLDDFKALAQDVVFFASQYARLDNIDKAFMAKLIEKHVETTTQESKKPRGLVPKSAPLSSANILSRSTNKKTSLTRYKVQDLFPDKKSSSTHNEALLEHLHDIHFINWLKNRSSLMETQDTVEITEEFNRFLEKILFLTESEQVVEFFTKNSKQPIETIADTFTSSDWNTLQKLALSYAVPLTFITQTKPLLDLVKKALKVHLATLGIFSQTGEIFVVLNPIFSQLPSPTSSAKTPSPKAQPKPQPDPSATAPNPFQPKTLSSTEVYPAKRKITQKLFTLVALLYEKKTKEVSLFKDIPIKNDNELDYLTGISKLLLTHRRWRAFLKKSVHVKIRIILKIGNPDSYMLLKELLALIEGILPAPAGLKKSEAQTTENIAENTTTDTAASKSATTQGTSDSDIAALNDHQIIMLPEHTLLIALNQKRFWDHTSQLPSHLTSPHFKSALKPLQEWKIIDLHKNNVTLDLTLSSQITTTSTKTSLTKLSEHDKLIIDSDMSIIVFNEMVSLAALHVLSLFTKITFADHTTQCVPKLEFSHLSWFAGLDEVNTIAALKHLSPDYFTRQVAEYFHLYFEHIALTRVQRAILLKTSSQQVFLKMKYALEKVPELKQDVLFLEKQTHLLFYKKQTYLKAKKILSQITSII